MKTRRKLRKVFNANIGDILQCCQYHFCGELKLLHSYLQLFLTVFIEILVLMDCNRNSIRFKML